MLKVTKFGGSSLCDSAGFSRVREIVLADTARRFAKHTNTKTNKQTPRAASSSCRRQAGGTPPTTRSRIFSISATRICNTA